MQSTFTFFKKIIPASLKHKINIITGRINSYEGNYDSWEEALADSDGYNSDILLNKIISSNEAVLAKKSCYERDGVLFDSINYAMEINACLLMGCLTKEGNKPFQIVDYGGSLGTIYRQFESFTAEKLYYKWNILEQNELYKYGAANLTQEKLQFHPASVTRIADLEPDLVVFSAVLEFLENFHGAINQAVAANPKWIVMDRVPTWSGNCNHLCVLRAAKHISGSYPCWIFGKDFFNGQMVGYELIASWSSLGGKFIFSKGSAEYVGMLWKRI